MEANAPETKASKSSKDPLENAANSGLNLGTFDIWALGITIVIGGQYFSWNAGLSAGFGSYFISTFLMGLAYICLCFCNAEITSALPFAGGAYGMARVTLGLYAGFIVGCMEAIEYIAYVASSNLVLSNLLCSITATATNMVPLYCLAFFIVTIWIQIAGGRWFWRCSSGFGVVSLCILLIYVFGSINGAMVENIAAPSTTSGVEHSYFIGGVRSFVTVTPLAGWWYVGVESLNLSCAFVSNPRLTVGRGSVLCICTLFVTSILTILVASSLPPLGETTPLALELAPLNNGFERMFSMSYRDASTLSIPATFATAFGFVYGYSRVILSMARSGLFPSYLSLTFGKYRTPYVAILVGSLLSYGLVLFAHFVPITQTYLYNICILSGFTAYVSQLSGFILFRVRHPDQERLYASPLGIPGAVFGIVVFSFSAVSVMGFQNDRSVAFVTYLFLILFASVYYFAYARRRQYFSVEESFIFSIQIIKFNEHRRKAIKSGSHSLRVRSSSGSGTVQLPVISFAHITAAISPRRVGSVDAAKSELEIKPSSHESTRFIPLADDRKSARVKSNAVACESGGSNSVERSVDSCLVNIHSDKSMRLQQSLSNTPLTALCGAEENV